MNFDKNRGFKLYVQLVSLAIAGAFLVLFTDFFHFEKQMVAYVLLGLFAALFIPLIGSMFYAEWAKKHAFKTRERLKIYPLGEGAGGRIVLDVRNTGDGCIYISSAGFIDRHWERNGNSRTAVDSPIYTKHPQLPLRLQRGEETRFEFTVIPQEFENVFAGVFYDIDLHKSDLFNKYSKYLLSSETKTDWGPQGFLHKKVLDSSLQKKFCGKLKGSKLRFWMIIFFVSLWILWMAFVFLWAFCPQLFGR